MTNKFQASRSWLCISILWLGLGGCVGIPEGTEPVKDFSLEQYLGTWYEIARMDHRFERDLSNVTADYRLNVIALDQKDYQWSLVTGPDKDYLWILSRTPVLDQAVVDELVSMASAFGYKTDELIFDSQDKT
jgi:apolipoprotein D and lipocalin family protein